MPVRVYKREREGLKENYICNRTTIDARDDDGPVTADAEAETLVVKFAQAGVARWAPF